MKLTSNHKMVYGARSVVASSYRSATSSVDSKTVDDGGTGVLARIEGLPLAWYDIPTANNMTYPRELWEILFADKEYMDNMNVDKSYYGEDDHYDENHVKWPRVSHRISDLRFGKRPNQIVGTVEILPTRRGWDLFQAHRSGGIGFSTRGLALFDPDPVRGQDYVILRPDSYYDVCIDAVVNPAVFDAKLRANDISNLDDSMQPSQVSVSRVVDYTNALVRDNQREGVTPTISVVHALDAYKGKIEIEEVIARALAAEEAGNGVDFGCLKSHNVSYESPDGVTFRDFVSSCERYYEKMKGLKI